MHHFFYMLTHVYSLNIVFMRTQVVKFLFAIFAFAVIRHMVKANVANASGHRHKYHHRAYPSHTVECNCRFRFTMQLPLYADQKVNNGSVKFPTPTVSHDVFLSPHMVRDHEKGPSVSAKDRYMGEYVQWCEELPFTKVHTYTCTLIPDRLHTSESFFCVVNYFRTENTV